MYNEEMKQRYIKSIKVVSYAKKTISVFNKIAPYENSIGKDFYEMSIDEYEKMIEDGYLGDRKKSIVGYVSILSSYINWCLENNIEGASNALFGIKRDYNVKVGMADTVSCPEALETYLDKVFFPLSEDNIDTLYRAYYWLSFVGFDPEDILKVKESDVDIKNKRVYFARIDRFVPLPDESIETMKRSLLLTSFKRTTPRGGEYFVDKIPGDLLFRNDKDVISRNLIKKNISVKINSLGSVLEPPISPGRVKLSGIFYRAYMMEMNGLEPDFESAVRDDMAGKKYSSPQRTSWQMLDDYRDSYPIWKSKWY